jgi:hypothetical protein
MSSVVEYFTKEEALELVGQRAVIKVPFPNPQLKEGVVGRFFRAVPRSSTTQYLMIIEWDALQRLDSFTKSEVVGHLSVG